GPQRVRPSAAHAAGGRHDAVRHRTPPGRAVRVRGLRHRHGPGPGHRPGPARGSGQRPPGHRGVFRHGRGCRRRGGRRGRGLSRRRPGASRGRPGASRGRPGASRGRPGLSRRRALRGAPEAWREVQRMAAVQTAPMAGAAAAGAQALVVENLVAGYGKVEIVHGVSMTARQGQVAVVLGPNGSGKSTFVKAVYGLATQFAGAVKHFGENIMGAPPEALAARGIGYVPQRENVFTTLTVQENLDVGLASVKGRTEKRERLEWVYELFPLLRE